MSCTNLLQIFNTYFPVVSISLAVGIIFGVNSPAARKKHSMKIDWITAHNNAHRGS